MKRTILQNKSLHLYLRLLSEALNDAGLDMKKVLKPTIAISWNEKNAKEYLWRPVQEALLLKKSTTELSTDEIDKVYQELNRHISEKFGIHVAFPSEEDVIFGEKVVKNNPVHNSQLH